MYAIFMVRGVYYDCLHTIDTMKAYGWLLRRDPYACSARRTVFHTPSPAPASHSRLHQFSRSAAYWTGCQRPFLPSLGGLRCWPVLSQSAPVRRFEQCPRQLETLTISEVAPIPGLVIISGLRTKAYGKQEATSWRSMTLLKAGARRQSRICGYEYLYIPLQCGCLTLGQNESE